MDDVLFSVGEIIFFGSIAGGVITLACVLICKVWGE